MAMMRKLAKLWRLSWRDRLLLAEAAVALLGARLIMLLVPFRRIAPRLGETMGDSPAEDPADPRGLKRIGWAVNVASKVLPWHSTCLTEAIAAKAMLKRRGVVSTLYLGLARDGQSQLEAHAWLRCGSSVLTGGGASEGYTVIASFAEPAGRGPRR